MTSKNSNNDSEQPSTTQSVNTRKNASNPAREPRFLCDEMLRGLARWLRAAGYDTETAEAGCDDVVLLQQAYDEQRCFLTRDRKIMQHNRVGASVIVLTCNDTESCACALTQQIALNWLFQPFTRCLLCNTPLKIADPSMLKRVPNQSRMLADPLLYCPTCNKIYWDGSHVSRMRQRLQKWAGLKNIGD